MLGYLVNPGVSWPRFASGRAQSERLDSWCEFHAGQIGLHLRGTQSSLPLELINEIDQQFAVCLQKRAQDRLLNLQKRTEDNAVMCDLREGDS